MLVANADSDVFKFFGVPWSDAFTALATTIAVILALLLALGAPSWIFRPRLRATLEDSPLDHHLVDNLDDAGKKQSDQYYFRLRVGNGQHVTAAAKSVELLTYALWDVSGNPRALNFLPLNLCWSHVVWTKRTFDRRIIMPIIQSGHFRHCDLFYVDNGKPDELVFSTHVHPTPINGEMTTKRGPGSYELDLTLVAENFEPEIVTVGLAFTGTWPSDGNFDSLLTARVLYQGRTPPSHPIPPPSLDRMPPGGPSAPPICQRRCETPQIAPV